MTEPAELPQDAATAAGVPPSARLLLRIVYIMGIILVLLFLTLVGGIIWKSTRPPAPKVPALAPVVDLGLAPGATVQSVELDGDRVAVRTAAEVIVVDISKNEVISRISLQPK